MGYHVTSAWIILGHILEDPLYVIFGFLTKHAPRGVAVPT